MSAFGGKADIGMGGLDFSGHGCMKNNVFSEQTKRRLDDKRKADRLEIEGHDNHQGMIE